MKDCYIISFAKSELLTPPPMIYTSAEEFKKYQERLNDREISFEIEVEPEVYGGVRTVTYWLWIGKEVSR